MAIVSLSSIIGTALVGGAIYILFMLWSVWRGVRKRDKVLEQLPHSERHWFLGQKTPGFNDAGLAYLRMLGHKFPRCSAFWDHILHATIQVRHPDLLKLILKRLDPKPTENGLYGMGRAWLGDGLILSNNRKWERHRKLLTNAFHFDILHCYVNVMNDVTDVLLFPGFNDAGLAYYRELNHTFPRIMAFWDTVANAGLQLKHPDYIKLILKRSDPKPSQSGVYSFGRPWLGDGLLLSNDRKWALHRKLLTNAFHFEILRGYIVDMHDASEVMLTKLEAHASEGSAFPLYTTMSLCTLDVLLRCAFSYQSDVQERGDDHPYVIATRELGKIWLNRATSLIGYLPIWNWTADGRAFHRHCQYVHSVCDEVIKKRRETLNQNDEDTTGKSSRKCLDFLDVLLVARDEDGNGLTDTDIRDEVSTFMFAGHDTTASSLSWTLFELALHPEYQDRCQREIDDILEGRSSDEITWGDLSRLPYLTMCIKEAMRLHAIVPLIMRELKEDLVLDGKLVPKGQALTLHTYSLHHNPLIWENSMEYRPDRFSPENMEKRDPFSFLPFSAGARNCIGQNFSMNEQKVALTRILKRFRVSADPEMELVTTVGLVTHPSKDMKLNIIRRI